MPDTWKKIVTVCECIDHCFAFDIWCDDFAHNVVEEDMICGLNRGFEVMSDAARLQSFLALRKLDEFLCNDRPKPDDLTAQDLGLDTSEIFTATPAPLLSREERVDINKGVAHLTEQLTLDPDSEVDLQILIARSRPVFLRLVRALRSHDTEGEAAHWLDRTDALICRVSSLQRA